MGHGGESGGGYVVGGGSDTTMAEAGDRADTERTRQTYERRREKDRDREGGRGTVKVLTFDKPPPLSRAKVTATASTAASNPRVTVSFRRSRFFLPPLRLLLLPLHDFLRRLLGRYGIVDV